MALQRGDADPDAAADPPGRPRPARVPPAHPAPGGSRDRRRLLTVADLAGRRIGPRRTAAEMSPTVLQHITSVTADCDTSWLTLGERADCDSRGILPARCQRGGELHPAGRGASRGARPSAAGHRTGTGRWHTRRRRALPVPGDPGPLGAGTRLP